jgi:hypothetical protein
VSNLPVRRWHNRLRWLARPSIAPGDDYFSKPQLGLDFWIDAVDTSASWLDAVHCFRFSTTKNVRAPFLNAEVYGNEETDDKGGTG